MAVKKLAPKKTATAKKPAAKSGVIKTPAAKKTVSKKQTPAGKTVKKNTSKITQITQPLKREIAPKSAQIAAQKKKFIESLKQNGIASDALKASRLTRKTAYLHFSSDQDFADEWLDALDTASDDLIRAARKRAVDEKSDTLLIYLLNQNERQQKWRQRIIDTGNFALKSIAEIGKLHGLEQNVIEAIQAEMTDKFTQIKLI